MKKLIPPLVSVVVPNYNYARYFDRRMHSILNQTYQKMEVIILDDSSTDNSIEVIEKYRNEPRVSHIEINTQNSGNVFLQWDKGIKLAKGEIIWIAEADDWCESTMIETLVKAYKSRKGTVLAYSTSLLVEENDRPLWKVWPSHNRNFSGMVYTRKYLLLENFVMNASSAIFSREAALKVNTEYKNIKGAGDYAFWADLVKQGRVAVVNKVLNRFVRHAGTVTDESEFNGTNGRVRLSLVKKMMSYCHPSCFRRHYVKMYQTSRLLTERFDSEQTRQNLLDYFGVYSVNPFWIKILKINHYLRLRRNIYL